MNEKIALASQDLYGIASWKRREKTIDEVLMMYGALQGITGSSAIVHIDALELPESLGEDE